MNPFVSWLLAVVVGIVISMLVLVVLAYVATYYSIWAAGIALLFIIFGNVVVYCHTYKGEE